MLLEALDAEQFRADRLFGVRGNMIEWSVSGVLNDPGDVRSIAASWVAGAAP